jgi:hypothetical protein
MVLMIRPLRDYGPCPVCHYMRLGIMLPIAVLLLFLYLLPGGSLHEKYRNIKWVSNVGEPKK